MDILKNDDQRKTTIIVEREIVHLLQQKEYKWIKGKMNKQIRVTMLPSYATDKN